MDLLTRKKVNTIIIILNIINIKIRLLKKKEKNGLVVFKNLLIIFIIFTYNKKDDYTNNFIKFIFTDS